MVELSRRSFLGGALSVLAASTFVPRTLAGNIPSIWADGKHDDTYGLAALFRKEPVIFATDKLGVDSHGGIIFHSGRYKITETIELPSEVCWKVESAEFDLIELPEDLYAFRGVQESVVAFTGLFTKWKHYVPAWQGFPARGVRDRRRFIETLGAYDFTDDLVA